MIETAIAAAKEAGAYLRKNIGRATDIQTKDGQERNLVSEIDKGSERMIIDMILGKYPGHAVLAEEGGTGAGSSDYRWVIDPLDGTTNFLHGIPVFCVTIGLEHKGRIVCGVVYDPNFEELYTAESGSGAFLNGTRISVSRTSLLSESLLVTGFPYDIATNPDNAIGRFVGLLKAARGIRRLGSAALDLCWVAAGRFDGFWEVNLHPWDIAAGLLMVQEAGGVVTDFSGAEASIYKSQVLASNRGIHGEMKRALSVLGTNDLKSAED
jgi:myo-inositol-1(or 4)-monophosphatase